MKKTSIRFKITALITLGAFVFSGILQQPLYAAVQLSRENTDGHSSRITAEETLIPSSIGRVNGGQDFNNSRLVIIVQDLHGNPSAQKNIHQILSLLSQKLPGARVFLEGAPRGQFTPELLTSIPDTRTREEAAKTLLDQGILSGGEYYALRSTGTVFGLEDESCYRGNLFRLRALIATRPAREKTFHDVSADITRLKEIHYSRPMRAFARSISRIDDDSKSLEHWGRSLEKTASAYREDLQQYPNIYNLIRMNKLNRRLSWNRIEGEQKAAIEELKSRIPYRQYSEMQSAMSRDTGEFYTAFQNAAPLYLPEFRRRYPHFSDMLEWHALNRKINPLELMNERDSLIARLYEKSAATKTERDIALLDSANRRAGDMALLAITPSDYAAFVRDEFKYRELALRYLGADQSSGLLAIIDNQLLRQYHAANLTRNEIFIQTIVSDPPEPLSLKHEQCAPRDVKILVAGGFHSGLIDVLAEKRISYLIVTPQITGKAGNDHFTRMVDGTIAPETIVRSAFGWLASLASRACDGGHSNVFRIIVGVTLRSFIRTGNSLPAAEGFVKDWFAGIEQACRRANVDAPKLDIVTAEDSCVIKVAMGGKPFEWRIYGTNGARGAKLAVKAQSASVDGTHGNGSLAAPAAIIHGIQGVLRPIIRPAVGKRDVFSETITPANKKYFAGVLQDMLRFFTDTVNDTTNYLPPDYVQMSDKNGAVEEIVYRTSTTNIGLYILVMVAAMKRGMIEPEEGLERISKTIRTVQELLKDEEQSYHGHLYNWCTIDGTPQQTWGRHISTVDNGNLAGALIAAEQGLAEMEGGRRSEDSALLRKSMRKIINGMDFGLLYDEEAGLLHMGADVEDGVLTLRRGHYNMVMSESRIAYMAAIMLGQIPPGSWNNLCGHIIDKGVVNDKMELQSWSGTMFEYLMACLLAKEDGTLVGEANRQAVEEQMTDKQRFGIWGKSEAAATVTAFWAALGYLRDVYVAWCKAETGQNREFMDAVFAPYASMLAVRMAPNAVAENLKKMASLGLRNKYGFFESVRVEAEKRFMSMRPAYRVMRRYYSHHQGMSFLAMANALENPEGGGIVTDWFHNSPYNTVGGSPYTAEEVNVITARFDDRILELLAEHGVDDPSAATAAQLAKAFNRLIDMPNLFTVPGEEYEEPESEQDKIEIRMSNKRKLAELYPETFSKKDVVKKLHEFKDHPDGEHELTQPYVRDPKLAPDPKDFVGRFSSLVYAPKSGGWSGWSGGDFAVSCNKVFYIKDVQKDEILPIGLKEADTLTHENGRAVFTYKIEEGIKAVVELSYSSVDTAEIWKLTILNETTSKRSFQVTGYQDWIMQDINAYLDHPVLQNLYVKTEYRNGVITARRRTVRGLEQILKPIGFFMIAKKDGEKVDGWDTSRLSFLGRLGNLAFPRAVLKHVFHGNSDHTTNPAAALSKTLEVPGGGSQEITFVSGCAESPEKVEELTAGYRNGRGDLTEQMILNVALPPDKEYFAMCELRNRALRALRLRNFPAPDPDSAAKEPGRWSEDGREYIIEDPLATKMPWSMVVSNGVIGFVATAVNWAYSFYGQGENGNNSQQGRITPYIPDMVAETPLRGVMVKNKKTGREWPLQPSNVPGARYQSRVSTDGYIKYILHVKDVWGEGELVDNGLAGLTITMTMFVDEKDPVEFWKIDVTYEGVEPLELEFSSFVKWALGDRYPQTAHLTDSSFDPESGAILARNVTSIFPGSVAFHALAAEGDVESGTSMHRKDDPFDGLSTSLHLDGKGTEPKSIAFMLGQAESEAETIKLNKKYRKVGAVQQSFEVSTDKMRDTLAANTINTPDASLNNLFPFLLYQADVAHIRARSGMNQSGGAFGFRDQLQTVTNLLATGDIHYYKVAKDHIIDSTKHQFERRQFGDRMAGGDVQHWWHPHNNLGQRSRISDNLLWLPYALSQYLEKTGDYSILDEMTPWLALDDKEWENGELRPGELDRCFVPRSTEEDNIFSSVFEHCKATIDRGLDRMGEHGLPLIGSGDWNDALNRVGPKGRGESVWLAFFMYYNMVEFAKIAEIQAVRCEAKGTQTDIAKAEEYRAAAAEYTEKARILKENIEKHGWNRDHYIRAYMDSGEKLDLIDAIVQSWAVMSGGASEKRASKAFKTAVKRLYRAKHKIIMLFDKPVDDLIDYPPGKRENMAQYTHGTTWMIIAAVMLGDGDLAYRLFQALLPTTHSLDPNYGGEPFAVAADISGPAKKIGDDQEGKVGWTWYTGAAGWIYRILMEYILGIRFRAGYMQIEPCVTKEWKKFGVTHRHRASPENPGSMYSITFENPSGVCTGVKSIVETVFDASGNQVGESVTVDIAQGVKLADDGLEHRIHVVMGPADPVKKGIIAEAYAGIFDWFLIKPEPGIKIRPDAHTINPAETIHMLSAS